MSTNLKLEEVTPTPTAEELVARARKLIPVLRERAAYGVQHCRLPDETINDLREAGLFRILQPKHWGGYEMHPNVFYDVVMALAEGDMSVAWVFSVVGVHPWQLAVMDDRAARDVWGEDNSVLIASTYMPVGRATRVEGGFRFSGRWGYSSGSAHCDWVFLGGMVYGPDGERTGEGGSFMLPRADYEIVETWDTPGLRGTGSNDIVVNDVFVPEYRALMGPGTFLCKNPGMEINDGPLYRMPYGQIFPRAVSTAAIGALQGMIDLIRDASSTRANMMGTRLAQDPVATLALAEAQNEVDELKCILHRNFDTLWEYAERGEVPPIDLRSQYRFQASLPPERVSQAALRLFKAMGGAAAYNKNPYGRILADINTGRQHFANQFEMFGRNWGALMTGADNTDFFL